MMDERCQRCGLHTAVVRRVGFAGGETALCESCLDETARRRIGATRGRWLPKASPADRYVAGFPGLTVVNLSGEGEGPSCPRCGLDWREFARTKRLGCPVCYETFGPVLERFFQQLERPGFD